MLEIPTSDDILVPSNTMTIGAVERTEDQADEMDEGKDEVLPPTQPETKDDSDRSIDNPTATETIDDQVGRCEAGSVEVS